MLLKATMALTGLYLLVFLTVHMLGNLLLLLPESISRTSFNAYSEALTSNPLIKVVGWLTYASIVVHAVVSALLTRRNNAARTASYAVEQRGTSSPWYSRSMGWLGVVTLIFIVLHMHAFWYRYHWGPVGYDSEGRKDLYEIVVTAFQEPWTVVLYVVCMILLGFHLQHGFAASLRSIGLYGAGFGRLVQRISKWVAWALAGPFIVIPIYVFVAFWAGGR
ncbi:MAG: succinate dehydrogenase cytochrome b subunit [Myxococcota bacterium]